MVTSKVSGMSTITRSSTPRHVMRRPEPGTTIPPATCSVSTDQVLVFVVINMMEALPRCESPRIRGWLASAGRRSAREEKSPTSSQPAMYNIYCQLPTKNRIIVVPKVAGTTATRPSAAAGSATALSIGIFSKFAHTSLRTICL